MTIKTVPHPTLPEARDRFLADIHAPRTAETYRFALTVLGRFLTDTHVWVGIMITLCQSPYPIEELDDDLLVAFYRWLSVQIRKPADGAHLPGRRPSLPCLA